MTRTTKTTLSRLALALSLPLAAVGCADAPPPGPEDAASEIPDASASYSAEGLTLEQNDPDAAKGRFERDGTTLVFSLTRSDGTIRFALQRANGEPLLDSTLAGGVDTTVVLGGRAKVVGVPDAEEPRKEGDLAALDAIAASPEAKLIPELKEALLAKGVDKGLLARPAGATGLAPQGWLSNGWAALVHGESIGFWSYSFWGTTTVWVYDENDPSGGEHHLKFQANAWSSEIVHGRGVYPHRRQWWGAYVTVTNWYQRPCTLVYWPSVYACPRTMVKPT